MAAVMVMVVALRFFQARTLLMPAWVDSVHHALLVRILVEKGPLPTTWAPYLPDVSFYYHFGFHLTAAFLARIANLDPGRAVLISGHIWQAGMVLAVFLAGRALWRGDRAWVAALLVAFVSQMPAHYVTWGRYTLLAGLTLMTLAIAAALGERSLLLVLAAIATGVTHYYAFVLLVLFLGCLFVVERSRRRTTALGAGISLIVLSPWFWRVFSHTQGMQEITIGAAQIGHSLTYLVALLGPLRNHLLLALAAAGCGVVIVRSRQLHEDRGSLAVVLWMLLQLLLLGPWRIGPFRPDHAAIVLFVPAVLLAAEALWHLRKRDLTWAMLALLVVWGVWETRSVVKPENVLVSAGDLSAINWVQEHTPADAVFLIDVEPWGGLWRGANGGWWIMPLTGRQTIPPPPAYGWGPQALIDRVNAVAQRLHHLESLPDHLYCQELTLLAADTEAAYYFTRTLRPDVCPGWRAVYTAGEGVSVYAPS